MRVNLLVSIALLSASVWSTAQNAQFIMAGASTRVVTAGTPTIVLSNTNWVNNAAAAAFNGSSGGIVRTKGTSTSTIEGTSPTTFFDLVTDKTAGSEVQLLQNAVVSHSALLVNGNFNLVNNQMTLGIQGAIGGEQSTIGGGRRFYCIDNNLGKIRKDTLFLAGIVAKNPGNMGAIITTAVAMGNTTIIRGHDRQFSATYAATGIGRYYDITPTVNAALNMTFNMEYHQDELAPLAEGSLVFYRSPTYAALDDWQEYGNGSYGGVGSGIFAVNNTVANTVFLGGIAAFSRWTASDALTAPLPVTLVSFTAECGTGIVNLNWVTASETNSKDFTIQRSTDLMNWEYVGLVSAQGNSNQYVSYHFTDERPYGGDSYYRLVQEDFNGAQTNIQPVVVTCANNSTGNENLIVYPNPAVNNFTVELTVSQAYGEGQLVIFDMLGQEVVSKNIVIAEGKNYYQFPSESYLPATYNIRLTSGDKMFPVKKLVIHK